MPDGCYVYAIVPASATLPDDATGFSAQLWKIAWRDIAAVVSSTRTGSIDPTPEHMLMHEAIVEALHTENATLPARFGTVLSDPRTVSQALEKQYDVLAADLKRLGDTVEFTVTALWPDDQRQLHIGQADGSAAEHEIVSASTVSRGRAYMRRRMLQYRDADMLRKRAQALAADVVSALESHSIDHRGHLCPTGRIALRDVYLVARGQQPAFMAAFDELHAQQRAARLLLSGPWPPYSFLTPRRGAIDQ